MSMEVKHELEPPDEECSHNAPKVVENTNKDSTEMLDCTPRDSLRNSQKSPSAQLEAETSTGNEETEEGNKTKEEDKTEEEDKTKQEDKTHEAGKSTEEDDKSTKDIERVFKGHVPPEVDIIGIRGRHMRFVTDFFTTLVDIRWIYTLIVFGCGSVICWLLFALYYYVVAIAHEDDIMDTTIHMPCFENVKTFLAAFIYSMETMSTIGCGYFYVTEECPQAYSGVIVQSILGAAIQAGIAGLVIAKMKVFKSASETIIFSKVACVVVDDLKMKLMVRIANIRKSTIIGPHVKGMFMRRTEDGELPDSTELVKFTAEGGHDELLLLWPETVVHVIDEKSPFWKMSKEDFTNARFELVLIFGGTSESVGANLQITTSYMPDDILWSHRFRPMLPIRSMGGQFEVDVQTFDEVYYSPTPSSSAYSIHKLFKSEPELRKAKYGYSPCQEHVGTGGLRSS